MCLKFKEKIQHVRFDGTTYFTKESCPTFTQTELTKILIHDLGESNISKDADGWLIYNNKQIQIKNVTYLGYSKKIKANRSHKKRIQFSNKLKKTFLENKTNKVILGVYKNHHDNDYLYVLFDLVSNKIGKSKASHVYVSDLKNAIDQEIFTRQDKNKNTITVFKKEHLKSVISNKKSVNPFKEFSNWIFKYYPEWTAKTAIKEMHDAKFKDAKQTEWAGWYLEFLAKKFFNNNSYGVIAPYDKKIEKWKPDAFYKNPIDLKFHNFDKKKIPGNDYHGVKQAIKDYGKISLFVVEGSVNKEDDNFEISKWRSELFNKESNIHEKTRKLKSKVKIKSISWGDIDSASFDRLGMFNQGKNSNGNVRKPKLMYSKENLNPNFK